MTARANASAPLALLPGLGGSLSDLERHGQLARLVDYYFPAYLERFPRIRWFSYEPETLDELTADRDLRRAVEVVAPATRARRRVHALRLATGRPRRLLEECAIARVFHAPGAVPTAIARVPFVCTYGYSYPEFTELNAPAPLHTIALAAKKAAMRTGLRFVLRRAAATIVTSDQGEAEARKLGARTIHRIPNGVDVEMFRPRSAEPVYDVAFVGRLVRQKDLYTLVRALAKLDGRARACIVGNGPERGSLERACAEAGVEASFLGTVPHRELPTVLARCRSFVLPSLYEGNPKALLEAMAMGLPCIATDIPGIRELAGGDALLLFDSGDVEGLAGLVARVLADDELSAHTGEAASRMIEERFDIRRLVAVETDLLASLAGVDSHERAA